MTLTVCDILSVLSDEESLKIFRSISKRIINTEMVLYEAKLTKRQFNYRLSNLISIGLVIREDKKYTLTSLGKIVYHYTQNMLEIALENHWKLKAIDSVKTSIAMSLPNHEYNKVIA
jgi:predicted transcriptional regulator